MLAARYELYIYMYIIRINFSSKGSEQHQLQLHVIRYKVDKFSQLCKRTEKNIFIYFLIVQF